MAKLTEVMQTHLAKLKDAGKTGLCLSPHHPTMQALRRRGLADFSRSRCTIRPKRTLPKWTITEAGHELLEPSPFGYEEGETCNREAAGAPDGYECHGKIENRPVENCSCHIAPPCPACTEDRLWCPECGWVSADDPLVVKEEANIFISPLPHVQKKKRVLDPTKIDFITEMHSSSSMKRTGVYPPGTTREEVEKRVKGTFGGRFQHFGGGRFAYIAYTD